MNAPIPNEIVAEILSYKKSGTALDLGVGWGRNAIFLAASGFDVTGVDHSESMIRAFKQKALDFGVVVKAKQEDVEDIRIDGDYDVILSTSALHFIANPKEVIEKMKIHTKNGGLNVISAFTIENPDKGFAHLFGKGEIKGYYNGWEILHYKEYLTNWEQHDNLGPHRHFIAELIAQNKTMP